MSIESTEPTSSKVFLLVGIIFGLLNAIVWIVLGSVILSLFGSNNLYWWALACLTLNLGVSFAVSRQRARPVHRLFWVVGVTLFIMILCAFVFGFWSSYGVTDFGGLAFLVGAGRGSILGLIIGICIGVKTSASKISKTEIIQRIGEGVITSTVVGIGLSAIIVAVFAASMWLKDVVDSPYYPDLIEHVLLNVLLITPVGVVPSVIAGVTTALGIYAMNWWLRKDFVSQESNVA